VAIVGHNGAGKSTLTKLLLRFYDPQKGKILVDGEDLRNIELQHWYQHIGVLFQDYARYFLTLRENITFGNVGRWEETSRDTLEKILKLSKGEELFSRLPKGFDQKLGRWFEGGVELSGGQWQKVAIARAIYRDAPVLILDEPTSSIDADAEAEIFSNLHEIYKQKNLIFISHRFSTVRQADKIVVLEAGTVVESGTHEELLQKGGLYSSFFQLQKSGYE
jgi:ATP-binding cassette subfamily B protein